MYNCNFEVVRGTGKNGKEYMILRFHLTDDYYLDVFASNEQKALVNVYIEHGKIYER